MKTYLQIPTQTRKNCIYCPIHPSLRFLCLLLDLHWLLRVFPNFSLLHHFWQVQTQTLFWSLQKIKIMKCTSLKVYKNVQTDFVSKKLCLPPKESEQKIIVFFNMMIRLNRKTLYVVCSNWHPFLIYDKVWLQNFKSCWNRCCKGAINLPPALNQPCSYKLTFSFIFSDC